MNRMYIGPEVNHTPAFSKRTLFVEDFQDTDVIESTARENKTPHISLAANNSFSLEYNWNEQLTKLLDLGFVVTLEYPAELHSHLMLDLSPGVLQSRNFVPLVKVSISELSTSNPNLTVKFDDNSHVGVWTLHFHQIMDSNRFTATNEFNMDEVEPIVGASRPVVNRVVETPIKPISVSQVKLTNATETEVKNPQDIGLDLSSPSMLKPEPESTEHHVAPVASVNTVAEAADLYAADAKTDPVAEESSKKLPKAKKQG